MKILFFLISILLIGELPVNAISRRPDYVSISNSIKAKIDPKLANRYQMDRIGTHASMMYCIKMMGTSFYLYRPLELPEARRLIINCVEEYLTEVNASKEIRPFLENYPATSENVEIAIYSFNPDHSSTFDPLICVVACENGVIVYRTKDKNMEFGYKTTIKEPYAEALAIIRSEKLRDDADLR